MKREDFFTVMDCVPEQYVTELMQHRRPQKHTEQEQPGVMTEADGPRRTHGKSGRIAAAAAIAAGLVCVNLAGFLLIRSIVRRHADVIVPNPGTNLNSELIHDGSTTAPQTALSGTSQTVSEPAEQAPVEIGDGIYQVFRLPELERMLHQSYSQTTSTPACVYGTSYYGGSVEAFGRTVEFSGLPHEEGDHKVYYCILQEPAAVYFTQNYGRDLYRSDDGLQSKQRIFSGYRGVTDYLEFREIMAFPNTDLLFVKCFAVSGGNSGECRIGTLNPETGETDLISCNWGNELPCNTGVLYYSDSKKSGSKVLYWECGKIREIQLKNIKETYGVYLSENGRYLCTQMDSLTKDNRLISRFSVYDIRSGAFLRSFDRTFDSASSVYDGLAMIGVSEETQSLYLENRKNFDFYQFRFGEADGTANGTQPASGSTKTEPVTQNEPAKSVQGSSAVLEVAAAPDFEAVRLSGTYGRVERRGDMTAVAYWKTLDFSQIPGYFDIAYCVPEDRSAVFFTADDDFYRSDTELKSPELLFHLSDVCGELVRVYDLIPFANTDVLFFRGNDMNGAALIGSIDTAGKEIRYSRTQNWELAPCSTGVMVYDYDAAWHHRTSTVQYWERGEIYEIPVKNAKETESPENIRISPNGRYIGTVMQGKTKDGSLTERCSVYDVKTGALIGSFDRDFRMKYGTVGAKGFELLGFDEDAQSLYVKDLETYHINRFDFGASRHET